MRISDLLSNSVAPLGAQVSLEGVFVLVAGEGYLVDTIDERDNKSAAVRVQIPNIKQVMVKEVPPSGGSKYNYLSSAWLTGVLVAGQAPYVFELQHISSFDIQISDYLFSVSLPN